MTFEFLSFVYRHIVMVVLDWRTAETFIRTLHRDPYTRFSTLPLDIVDSLAPYLHTYTINGISYLDRERHGSYIRRNDHYYFSHNYVDSNHHGPQRTWLIDGSLFWYSEYNYSRMMLGVEWLDQGICIRICVADGYHSTLYDTLPHHLRYIWELMTHTIDV